MLLFVLEIVIIFFEFGCVGRGVLRFWEGRYRKPRSNLGGFGDFYDLSVSGGVDII